MNIRNNGGFVVNEAALQPRKRRCYGKKKDKRFWPLGVIVILLIASVIIICFRTDKVKGIWNVDDVTAYHFDGKGHGELILPDKEYKFVYKLTKNEISIDFESESAKDISFNYSLEKDKLILKQREASADYRYILTREDGKK